MKAYKNYVNEETMKIDIVEFDIDNKFDFSHDPVTTFGDYSLKKCKDCNRYFLLPKTEKEWFEERGLAIPKRCRKCRKKVRMRNDRDT